MVTTELGKSKRSNSRKGAGKRVLLTCLVVEGVGNARNSFHGMSANRLLSPMVCVKRGKELEREGKEKYLKRVARTATTTTKKKKRNQ